MPVCRTLFFSFVLFLSRGLSAQNLVPNPSFSDINICTEYASPCEPAAWWRVAPHVRRASPIFNPSGAGSGESYIQLESSMMAQQRREYMQTRLLAPMKPGKKYLITVYAGSRDDAAPGIDLLFAEHDVYAMFVQRLDYTPTIELRKAQQIKFNKPWHVYQLEYTPDRRYTNLILGDFSPSRVPRNHEESGLKYLCVDSICVEPIEAKEKLDPAMARNVYNEHHRHTLPDAFLRDHGLDLVRMVPTVPTDTSAWRKWQDLSQKLHSRGGRVTIDPKMRELLQNGSSHCDTLIIGSGIFINNGAGLNTDFGFVLDSALQYYESGRSGKIKVIGHVNQPGTDRFNELLSVDRAKEVVKHLVYRAGFSYDDFEVTGMGRSKPRYDTGTLKGRQDNERVEIIVCSPPVFLSEVPPAPPKADTLVIPDVLFKTASAALEPRFMAKLDSMIQKIPKDKVELQVIGHTDNEGTDAYNDDLSRRRASTVSTFLGMKGYGDKVRYIHGEGERRPVATNATPEGRLRNRRVEIIIHKIVD